MIGTDSHTPNAGGLGMFASGVGGADAVDVMSGFPWEVLQPKLIGVKLTGEFSGWAAPKDVILKLLGILTVKAHERRRRVLRTRVRLDFVHRQGDHHQHGPEHGATTSIFPYDAAWRPIFGRQARGDRGSRQRQPRPARGRPEVEARPEGFFGRVVEIDLSALEPYLVGPHTPDLARPLSKVPEAVRENGYTAAISVALVGSCTNSSYEDITRAAAWPARLSRRVSRRACRS